MALRPRRRPRAANHNKSGVLRLWCPIVPVPVAFARKNILWRLAPCNHVPPFAKTSYAIDLATGRGLAVTVRVPLQDVWLARPEERSKIASGPRDGGGSRRQSGRRRRRDALARVRQCQEKETPVVTVLRYQANWPAGEGFRECEADGRRWQQDAEAAGHDAGRGCRSSSDR